VNSSLKTTKEIKAQKYGRLNIIIEAINKQPHSLSEIEEVVYHGKIDKIGKRTIFNDLEELEAIGIIEQDDKSKLYVPKGVLKQTFTSKQDYLLALYHSKELFNQDGNYPPWVLADIVIRKEDQDSTLENFDLMGLKSHFKTGYPDLWRIIEESQNNKEHKDLKDSLTKELWFIGYQLEHGTPLYGYCNLCPNRKVAIKDDEG